MAYSHDVCRTAQTAASALAVREARKRALGAAGCPVRALWSGSEALGSQSRSRRHRPSPRRHSRELTCPLPKRTRDDTLSTRPRVNRVDALKRRASDDLNRDTLLRPAKAGLRKGDPGVVEALESATVCVLHKLTAFRPMPTSARDR
jgi:hypothetical protein